MRFDMLYDLFNKIKIAEIQAELEGSISLGPFGSSLNTKHYTNAGVPVIRGVNLNNGRFHDDDFVFVPDSLADKYKHSIVYSDDIVFTYKGTLGQVGIIPRKPRYERYIISPSHLKLTVDKGKTDPLFVYYFFKSKFGQQQLLANSSPTGTPGIIRPTKTLAGIEMPYPNLSEQSIISHVLGTLDDKIELNHLMTQILEAIARAIFKSWFIDFNPVRAKMEERKPFGMDDETAALFPGSFEDSEMGKIPKGWRIGRVDDLCELIENGGTPRTNESQYWENGSINWFTTGELNDGPLISSKKKITKMGLDNSACKLWEPGTILIALYASPTVGRLGILETTGTANQACSALVSKSVYGNQFLFYTLFFARDELNRIAVGSAQQNISQSVIRNHKILLPKQECVKVFHDLVSPLHELKTRNTERSMTLASIREILLPKLISGEIRIKPQEEVRKV